jgi:hypothetical protein
VTVVKKTFGDLILIGLVFALLVGINVIQAYKFAGQMSPLMMMAQFALFFCYLGWVAMSEFRRIGKYRFITTLRVIGMTLIVAALFSSTMNARLIFGVLLGVVMLIAFVVAMWYRFANKHRDI